MTTSMPPIVSQSNDPAHDALTAPGVCGTRRAPAPSRTAAATARACRCWSSRPARSRTTSTHTITDQTSILRFIEDNWGLGRIGNQSFDAKAGPLNGMFDFGGRPHTQRLILNPITGEVVHH